MGFGSLVWGLGAGGWRLGVGLEVGGGGYRLPCPAFQVSGSSDGVPGVEYTRNLGLRVSSLWGFRVSSCGVRVSRAPGPAGRAGRYIRVGSGLRNPQYTTEIWGFGHPGQRRARGAITSPYMVGHVPPYTTRGYSGEQNKTLLKGFVRLRRTCSPLNGLHVLIAIHTLLNPFFCSPG